MGKKKITRSGIAVSKGVVTCNFDTYIVKLLSLDVVGIYIFISNVLISNF